MKLTCNCTNYIDTDEQSELVTKYENNPVIKKISNTGDKIIQEVFYYYICPKCCRDVIEIHRYKKNGIGKKAKVEKEILVGYKATNYLIQSRYCRKEKRIQFKEYIYSKGIPLRYGKAINSETIRMRYINEACFDGNKIVSKVKIFS